VKEVTYEYRVVDKRGTRWADFPSKERCEEEIVWLDKNHLFQEGAPFRIQNRIVSEWSDE